MQGVSNIKPNRAEPINYIIHENKIEFEPIKYFVTANWYARSSGCVFWAKFELFLKKIRWILTINLCAMRMVVKNFIMCFNNINNSLFLIEGKRKRLNIKYGRAKIPSPGPLPFCMKNYI